ncbi:MAG: GMC oxidoreductase [Hyphomonadaceae bacterium]
MPLISSDAVQPRYDLVIGGTGFGAIFFLEGYLRRFPRARVLMLEWGAYKDHAWQLANQRNSEIEPETTFRAQPGEKPWYYTIGFGGGTNCWWGQTPRLAPNDFRLKSTYGVGEDWPLSYDDLEPYYLDAERLMHVSGPNDLSRHYPRSGDYPQPPHHMSSIDKAMKAAAPHQHFANPCARLRVPVAGRGACCSTANCSYCPTEAKFTVLNTFGPLIARSNVDVLVGARVLAAEMAAGVAQGVRFSVDGAEKVVAADLVAMACNAIQTPFILMRSGLDHPALGKYLHEKMVVQYEIILDGLNGFDGGAATSGCNISWVDGDHRRESGAGLVFFINHWNNYGLRTEYGKWCQTLPLEVFIEDLPQETNFVADEGGDFPAVHHPARSEYCLRGAARVEEKLPELLAPLPVREIIRRETLPTGFHIQGTCRMGADPATSVVSADMKVHGVSNLLVLGTSVWPSCGTANPSLTAAALSLRAAKRLAA